MLFIGVAAPVAAREASQQAAVNNESLQAIFVQMQELRTDLNDMRDQLASSRRESQALRQELDSMRDQLIPGRNGLDSVSTLAEGQQVIEAKIEDQYQSKVESGSRYRVRLSGLALMNVFSNRGTLDNIDLPSYVAPTPPGAENGSFGASARQSQINFNVFGPEWKGARSSGEVSMDFFGGFPTANNGVSSGIARLRTATMSLDWSKTSATAGQDNLFFSPLSPTSLASTAYPALSSAGNLWVWTPQIRVEHRISLQNDSNVSVQGGILDSFTGEPPSEYDRTPTAGEQSRVPAVAARLGWERTKNDNATGVGAGGYYARQNWGFGRTVDAWAGTADWNVPLHRTISFSGELYRGRAIGGLGGGITKSVLFADAIPNSTPAILPLDSIGGWSQLKFKPVPKLEFNSAFGEDYPFRSGHGQFPVQRLADGTPVGRNASGFINFIYQPKSNLLFSVEYRRLWTSGVYDPKRTGDHVTVSSAIGF